MSLFHTEIGSGTVALSGGAYTLGLPAVTASAYHDAQVTDYLPRAAQFGWVPPVTLRLRARFNTADVRGTAGFGFWNHPFSPDVRQMPRLPQAAWFFYGSPPNAMPLAYGVPGSGWKCATLNATRPAFLALAPFALPGVLLMRIPYLYRRLWPAGQWALGIGEHALPPALLTEWHTYEILWQKWTISFRVDGAEVYQALYSPPGALGFIAWIDNQYAVVTPQGQFGWGRVAVPQPQALCFDSLQIIRESE